MQARLETPWEVIDSGYNISLQVTMVIPWLTTPPYQPHPRVNNALLLWYSLQLATPLYHAPHPKLHVISKMRHSPQPLPRDTCHTCNRMITVIVYRHRLNCGVFHTYSRTEQQRRRVELPLYPLRRLRSFA